jgi:hypothetical protein
MSGTTSQDVLNAILAAEQAEWSGYQRAIILTPDLAKLFLEHSQDFRNRNIRNLHLSRIVRAIDKGEWKINHQGLAFDIDGKLIDGQHRCRAVIKSGKSIPVLCFYNVPRDSFQTVDNGAKRSQADRFHCDGIADASTAASLVKLLWQYNYGLLFTNQEPSAQEFANFYKAIPQHIEESISAGKKLSNIRLFPPTAGALCFYIFKIKDKAGAEVFFEQLHRFGRDHEALTSCEGEKAAYRVARRMREETKAARRPTTMAMLAYLIKGWNAFRKGQDIKCLKYTEGEQLPKAE